jgi:glycosyltransferase involved in cell wall biosynthesis
VNNPIRLAAKMLGVFVGRILRKKDKLYMRNAEKIIVISRYTYKRITEIYNLFKSKIIYPAISDSFRLMNKKEMDDFKKKKGIKERYILAHGRIIPDKNYHMIISMLDRLDCNLIITGGIDEKYKKFLENAIEKEELATGVVNIVGRVSNEDLVGYYNCASVFVNPAFKEDFGLTPPEAMACGCPVVAWDDEAGPSETIIHNKTGILVDCPDGCNLCFEEGIRQALRKKWDREAIHNSIKRFSREEIEKQIIKEVEL